jgi:hypothetical protein
MRKETMKLRILVWASLAALPIWAVSAQVVVTNLYSFNRADGTNPEASPVQLSDGRISL